MRSERSSNPHWLATLLLVLAAVALTGCGGVRGPAFVRGPALPDVPDRYRQCFAGVTELPAGSWSAAVTADVVGRLRVSELGKTDCGRDFIEWYEDVKAGRNPKD